MGLKIDRILAYPLAASLGLIACAPPIPYDIPVLINSFGWLYAVIACALTTYFFCSHTSLHPAMKLLLAYLFLSCFLSQAPHTSFNAFILITGTAAVFLLFRHADYGPILDMAAAVFWLQVTVMVLQSLKLDTLMCFGAAFGIDDQTGVIVKKLMDAPRQVYLGTVFQQMRLSTLYTILSPLLLLKSRWYIIPIFVTSWMLGSLGYSLAIVAGLAFYVIVKWRSRRLLFIPIGALVIFAACAAYLDRAGIYVDLFEGRFPVWWVVLKTWVLDTTGPLVNGIQTGPWDWKRFFFGHGMDTFLPLFPFYKHDANPFPQAHNDWLQILWETGLIGMGLLQAYLLWLIRRLWVKQEIFLLACLVTVAVNMCFHFPMRMTQTWLPMVAFLAYCEQVIHEKNRRLA